MRLPPFRISTAAASAALATLLTLGSPAAAAGIELEDDTGRKLALAAPAQRIVSLAPHVTEMLFAAGAGERVVGAVDYSDYPEAAQRITRVGGYTRIDLEAVAALRPDVVIGWQSGNREGDLTRLQALGIPVYLSEPRNLEDVARNLERLGRLAGSERTAQAAASTFRTRREHL
nr:ABC transporter substrate-binding protein [Thauera sp.]